MTAPQLDEKERVVLPGFGQPVNKGIPRFFMPTALDAWASEGVTLRERRMLAFVNEITDKPGWEDKVFDEAIVEKWRAEGKAQTVTTPEPDVWMSDRMFEFCIKELQDKARTFKETGHVTVWDAEFSIVKSDTAVPDNVREALCQGVKPLEDVPERLKDWHPGSDGQVLDLVHPSLFPVVYTLTRALRYGTVPREGCIGYTGKGEPTDAFKPPGKNNRWDNTPALWGNFQWLPTDVSYDEESGAAKILGYINNLHPTRHADLYKVLEDVVAATVPLWKECLEGRYNRKRFNIQRTGDNDWHYPEGAKYRIPGRTGPKSWYDPNAKKYCGPPEGWVEPEGSEGEDTAAGGEVTDENTDGASDAAGTEDNDADSIHHSEEADNEEEDDTDENDSEEDEGSDVEAEDENSDVDMKDGEQDESNDDDNGSKEEENKEGEEDDKEAEAKREQELLLIDSDDGYRDDYTYDENKTEDEEDDDDDDDDYQDWRYEDSYYEWSEANRILTHREPRDHASATLKALAHKALANKDPQAAFPGRMQVVFKLASIHLTPEKPRYPGGSWHVEGALNERICASAIYYYDQDNVAPSRLAFRCALDEEALIMIPDQSEFSSLEAYYGVVNDGPRVQELGSVDTRQGRLLVFPNCAQHQVQPFELEDKTKPGHRKILAMFLIDPHRRVLSTSNVPPQRRDWWAEELREGGVLGPLPIELFNQTVDMVDDFPISWEKAVEIRAQLMEERSAAASSANTYIEQQSFSFCEH